MNKELFIAISDRLEAEVPELRWVDWDSGELDILLEPGKRPRVAFPCAMIDITYPRTDDQTDVSQIVTAQINIRLAFTPKGATNTKSPVRGDALAVFEVIGKVHTALQGWRQNYDFNQLSRQSARAEKRRDGLKVYDLVYSTTFEEVTVL
jgi:hypothetical protein